MVVFLTLSFPAAFFLNAVYTEGLFMCLLWWLLILWKRNSLWSILPAALLPLVRGQAYFLMAAIGVLLIIAIVQKKDIKTTAAIAGAFMLGFCMLHMVFWQSTGDPFAYLSAQSFFTSTPSARNSVAHLWDVPHFIQYLAKPSHLFTYENSLNDKLCIVCMFAAAGFVVRSRDLRNILLYAGLIVFPALMGEGVSYTRFALVAFPFLANSISPKLRLTVALIMLPAQMYLAWRFSINVWVA
jgi:hypothetical protein